MKSQDAIFSRHNPEVRMSTHLQSKIEQRLKKSRIKHGGLRHNEFQIDSIIKSIQFAEQDNTVTAASTLNSK